MSFERLLLRESQILWFLNSFFPSVARVFASSLRGRIYYRNLVLIELLEIEGYILERRILNSIIITGRSLNRVEKNRSSFNQPFDPIFRLDFIRVFFFSLSLFLCEESLLERSFWMVTRVIDLVARRKSRDRVPCTRRKMRVWKRVNEKEGCIPSIKARCSKNHLSQWMIIFRMQFGNRNCSIIIIR